MSNEASIEAISAAIRDIPDFPKPGILFKDITTLLAEPELFAETVKLLAERVRAYGADAIVGIESRGFIFGAAVAYELSLPLQLVRKPGKLPYTTVSVDYDLEYGSDRIEMHTDAIEPGKAYALVDDLIATGGTASAAIKLLEQQQGRVACCAFVVELSFLDGVKRLGDHNVEVLIRY